MPVEKFIKKNMKVPRSALVRLYDLKKLALWVVMAEIGHKFVPIFAFFLITYSWKKSKRPEIK
jgi:hypothetical protein